MNIKTNLHKTVVAALGVLTLSPALLFAGHTSKPAEERGVIKSVDLTAQTLVVLAHKKKTEQTFRWNDQTKFMERDQSASASALKTGEHVQLTYTAGKPNPTLQSVNIAPAKTAKPTAKNNSATKSNGA